MIPHRFQFMGKRKCLEFGTIVIHIQNRNNSYFFYFLDLLVDPVNELFRCLCDGKMVLKHLSSGFGHIVFLVLWR